MKSPNGALGVVRSDRCEVVIACPQAEPATERRHVSPISTLPFRSHFGSSFFLFGPLWQFGRIFIARLQKREIGKQLCRESQKEEEPTDPSDPIW